MSLPPGRTPVLTVCCPRVLKTRGIGRCRFGPGADLFEIQPSVKLSTLSLAATPRCSCSSSALCPHVYFSAVPARCCHPRAPCAEAESEGCCFSRPSLGSWLLGVRVMLGEAAALKPTMFCLKKKKCLTLAIGPGTRCSSLRLRKCVRPVPALSHSFHVFQVNFWHSV